MAIVADKTEELRSKKEALDRVNQKIRELQELFDEKVRLKEDLARKIDECQIKLDRAQKLTSGLSDEKLRWGNDVNTLSAGEVLVAGDSVIGAGMVA